MSKKQRWRRIEMQAVAVVDVAADSFASDGPLGRNQAFARALGIVADEINSAKSMFAAREIGAISLAYDPIHGVISAEATLVGP
jgi:hypothetical protein